MRNAPTFRLLLMVITIVIFLCTVNVQAESAAGVHWGYSGDTAPEYWSKLSPQYSLCSTGKNQSPIDLRDYIQADLQPLVVHYTTEGFEVVNNGHAIQVNFVSGSTLAVEGREYELKQIHFHNPSENEIAGQSFPLEGHLVHSDAIGNLAVVAVMYKEGDENSAIASAWQNMPAEPGEKKPITDINTATGFLPESLDYYRFNGSLTTPPCTEGVTWLVVKEAVNISADQVRQFQKVMGEPNNRPLQPINARVVLQ